MIKPFSVFKQKINESLEYEEEEDNDYKIGDYVTVIRIPPPPHWLNNTNIRTFKLTGNPSAFRDGMAWPTDGGVGNDRERRYGIPENYFRLATSKEIKEKYDNIAEGVRWYKDGKFTKDDKVDLRNTLMTVDAKKGDKVECIQTVFIETDRKHHQSDQRRFPIKVGEIKIVEGFHHVYRRVYFTDTPCGQGNYDGGCFVLVD